LAATSAHADTPWYGTMQFVDPQGVVETEFEPDGFDFATQESCLEGMLQPAYEAQLDALLYRTENKRTIVFEDNSSIDIRCLRKI